MKTTRVEPFPLHVPAARSRIAGCGHSIAGGDGAGARGVLREL